MCMRRLRVASRRGPRPWARPRAGPAVGMYCMYRMSCRMYGVPCTESGLYPRYVVSLRAAHPVYMSHVRVAYIVSHLWFQTSNKRMHACLTMCLTSLKVETSRRVSRDTLPSRETRPRRQFGSPVTLRDVQPFICRDAPRAPRRREMSMPRVRDRRRARTGTRTALLVQ